MEWLGPGIGSALRRLGQIVLPRITIRQPPPMVVERDLGVPVRDGVILRVNVFRPIRPGQFPVLLCAHPYGKDQFPPRVPWGWLAPKRFRFLRQPEPMAFSAYTTFEAPDPAYWVPRGYALVNVDLRGFGTSGGVATLFSDQEAHDYATAIAWAADQAWCNGKVGLNGVSYLAISQWKVAALHPQALRAICAWEGFSDVYHDVAYLGGVRDDGFLPFWAAMTEKDGRTTESFRQQQLTHPDFDDFWRSRVPDLEKITVPALICGSFSDHGLHSRGCFEAFRRINSTYRYLYTHRGGKWSTYYSPPALEAQTRFFDCFLRDVDNGLRDAAPVRLEVRSSAATVHDVRDELRWPPEDIAWATWHLLPSGLHDKPAAEPAQARLTAPTGKLTFSYTFTADTEIIGPMTLTLQVEPVEGSTVHLFAAIRKFRHGKHIPFEGSFGFGFDTVTKGLLRLTDLKPGETTTATLDLLPSATFFASGDTLRLDVQTRWFWLRNPFLGMYPGYYQPSPPATLTLHCGPKHPSTLRLPLRSPAPSRT